MTSILLQRVSKRAYLEKSVPQDILDRIIDKTRWAPSRSNSQPWRFVIVRDPQALARFQEGLTRGNAWAKTAPVLIAVVFGENGDAVRRDDPAVQYDLFACGLAVENLLLAAVEEGLMAHPMAGFNAAVVREALGVPDDHHIICVISLGYRGRIEDLDERTRAKDEAPRTRRDAGDMFFFDRWPRSESI